MELVGEARDLRGVRVEGTEPLGLVQVLGPDRERTARCQPIQPWASRRRRLAQVVMKVSSASFMT